MADDRQKRRDALRLKEERIQDLTNFGIPEASPLYKYYIQNGADKTFSTEFEKLNDVTRPPKDSFKGDNKYNLGNDRGQLEALESGAKANVIAAAKKIQDSISDRDKTIAQNNEMLGVIDSLINDPNREKVTGAIEGPFIPEFVQSLRGAGQAAANKNRIASQSFLQAYNKLRGGGHISDAEGKRAIASENLLSSAFLSDKDYEKALRDTRDTIELATKRMKANVKWSPTHQKFYRYNSDNKQEFVNGDTLEPLKNNAEKATGTPESEGDIEVPSHFKTGAEATKWIRENYPEGGTFVWNGKTVSVGK